MDQKLQSKLSIGLLSLRITVFIVFFFWGLDKIIVPEHAVRVMSGFYGLHVSINTMIVIGIAQMLFLAAFLLGKWKTVTYGAVFVLHGASTLSSLTKYFDPFNNLLFFTAWPMLAACFVLFLLRDYDTYSIDKK
ncbi:hypothetical protein VHA01S_038_00310 [Vibrio halioticoli NBRC 102217]|uniref:DoxX protein n=1 Tax=Vibrio halioticoli NBRC 102217 TaxID=1219072 RepID=V5F4L5_9VIBR|nr:hypothetical protein [Vibrio halioticoli]GAD90264.1 hypothetical protein VHA01S_038_00310 [Vibrio halioticoli NBRC 102217]